MRPSPLLFVLFLIFVIPISCKNSGHTVGNQELSRILQKDINKFSLTDSLGYLKDAYANLQRNKDYLKGQVGQDDQPYVFTTLKTLEKYDELISLIKRNKNIPEENKSILLNHIKFFKFKNNNKKKAQTYLKKNLNLIKKKIDKSPKDSLLYIDYFREVYLLKGKKKTFKKIDSLKEKNPLFSDDFYDVIKGTLEGLDHK